MKTKLSTIVIWLMICTICFTTKTFAENATSTYSIENLNPSYEVEFGDKQISKKIIINYTGGETKVRGQIKGDKKVLVPSEIKKNNDKKYYFTLDINTNKAVGDFKYKIDLNDYNGQAGSSTMQTYFNVKINGLSFDKPILPDITKTYTDYNLEIPFKLKNKVPIYFTIDAENGLNYYPIMFNDYGERVLKVRFNIDKLKDYTITIRAKSYENWVEIGKTSFKISPRKEKVVENPKLKVEVKSVPYETYILNRMW